MKKNKDFKILLFGRFITNFGDSIYAIATMMLVYELTASSFYTGLALFLTSSMAIFQVLFSPMLERVDMKRFLVLSQFIQAVLLLLVAYLIYTNQITVFILLLFMTIVSFINQLVYPGQLSLLPKILDQNELIKANSLFSIAYQGSDALFNALGGFMIAIIGTATAFAIDSGTFLINAVLFLFLTDKIRQTNAIRSEKVFDNHFKDLKAGLGVWKNPTLKSLLVGVLLINFSATAIFAILPEFATDSGYYGILLSASGLGVIIGSIIANLDFMKNRKLGPTYIAAILFTAVSWLATSFINQTTSLGRFLTFTSFLVGWILVGMLNIYSQTIVQLTAPMDKLSIALSAMVGLSVALAPFGALAAGLMSRYVSINLIIILACGLISIVGIYWYLSTSVRFMGDMVSLQNGVQG